jgi:DNA-binding MarR family transcriptional regulator
MNRSSNIAEYQALAQFRFLIRRYLNNSEKAARSVGLEPQQYMGLLALRGLPSDHEPTIRSLAERLQIQHHSAVELVDRMERRGLFRRERSRRDRRQVHLHVTPRGEKLLSRLVRHRIAELRVSAPELTHALQAVLAAASQEPGSGRRRRAYEQASGKRQKQSPDT